MIYGLPTDFGGSGIGVVLAVSERRCRGAKGRNDRLFLEALHYFSVHNTTWRALPKHFGKWNSVWKRL